MKNQIPDNNPCGLIEELKQFLASVEPLQLAVLIGSQANGTARPESDWDIAVQWDHALSFMEELNGTECLRSALSRHLGVAEDRIDLIDIPKARLAIRSVIVEEGLLLKGDGCLAWSHFLTRTWRELEEFYWETIYAA